MKKTSVDPARWQVTRRDFLGVSGSAVAGLLATTPSAWAGETERTALVRFGIVADSHYAERNSLGKRYYQESSAKMSECVTFMNEAKVDFVIELGDLKDQGHPATEESTLAFLDTIEATFAQFKGPRYHVLGNHDADSISKEQFLAHVESTGIPRRSKYYAFDSNGLHFIVLDANYKADGSDYDRGNFLWTDTNIPRNQLDWLQDDLASTSKPVVVFVHQRLDGDDDHCVKNAARVREVLESSENVLAVFHGHDHKGHYSHIRGIHYYTLIAMVEGSGEENNAYAVVEVHSDHTISVTGHRRALSRELARA